MTVEQRAEAPARGWKTKRVLESLQQGAMRMCDIKARTGLDLRTLNAILYALQHQGRVSPIDTQKTKSQVSFALVCGDVKQVEIVRKMPFKRRRRRPGVDSALGSRGQDVPLWLVPQLPKSLPTKPVGLVHLCILD